MRRDLLEQLKPFHTYAILELSKAGQVAARPGQTFDKSGPHWIDGLREHNRHRAGQPVQDCSSWTIASYDHIWVERDKFRRVPAQAGIVGGAPAIINPHISPDGPARLLKSLLERCNVRLCFRIFRSKALQPADPPQPVWLLRTRCCRPCRGRTTHKEKKFVYPRGQLRHRSVSNSAS